MMDDEDLSETLVSDSNMSSFFFTSDADCATSKNKNSRPSSDESMDDTVLIENYDDSIVFDLNSCENKKSSSLKPHDNRSSDDYKNRCSNQQQQLQGCQISQARNYCGASEILSVFGNNYDKKKNFDEDDFQSTCLERLDSLMLNDSNEMNDSRGITYVDDDGADLSLPRTSTSLVHMESSADDSGSTTYSNASTVLLQSSDSDSSTPEKCAKASPTAAAASSSARLTKFHTTLQFPPSRQDTALPCTECRSTFTSNAELHHHVKMIHPHLRRRHLCEHCGIGYTKKETLERHKEEKHQGHRCEICNRRYKRLETLRAHQKAKHANSRGSFDCEFCGKIFQRKLLLKKHMVIHNIGKMSCNNCGRMFRRKVNLVQHAKRCAVKMMS